MNTPIRVETAKLLKEKDIAIPSIFKGHGFHWYRDGEKDEFGNYLNNNTGEWKLAKCHTHTNEEYAAPTIAEVVMWIYEKNEIWIDMSLNQFSKPKDLQWMYSIVFTEDCTYSHSSKSYNSPIEAYEVAIQYTLKELI